jgi:hypothetical protein
MTHPAASQQVPSGRSFTKKTDQDSGPEKQTQFSNNLKLKNRKRPKRNSPTTKTIIQPSYNTPIARPSYSPLDELRIGRPNPKPGSSMK